MSKPDVEPFSETLTGKGFRLGIVKAKWNPKIVDRLLEGAHQAANELEFDEVVEVSVPGAFELPYGSQLLSQSGKVDGIVAIGCVIRGDTSHYDLVAGNAAGGIQGVQAANNVPITFGVATVEYEQQAILRSSLTGGHNLAKDAVFAAAEMMQLKKTLLG